MSRIEKELLIRTVKYESDNFRGYGD